MDYNVSVNVPKNTTRETAVEKTIKLTYGIITEVRIGFPDGCADLVRVTLWHGGHQVWPTNLDGWYAWNDYVFEIKESYELIEVPLAMTVKAWNLDEANDHEVMVGFNLLPLEPTLLGRFVQAILGRPARWR